MNTKKNIIKKISILLQEKRGYPDLNYLMKLSETELTWLIISICLSQEYLKIDNQIFT